jgi:hypothetical protein
VSDQTESAGKWNPFTVEDLDDLTWNEAFRKFVIGDAEVIALGERAIAADSGLLAVIGRGGFHPIAASGRFGMKAR